MLNELFHIIPKPMWQYLSHTLILWCWSSTMVTVAVLRASRPYGTSAQNLVWGMNNMCTNFHIISSHKTLTFFLTLIHLSLSVLFLLIAAIFRGLSLAHAFFYGVKDHNSNDIKTKYHSVMLSAARDQTCDLLPPRLVLNISATYSIPKMKSLGSCFCWHFKGQSTGFIHTYLPERHPQSKGLLFQ